VKSKGREGVIRAMAHKVGYDAVWPCERASGFGHDERSQVVSCDRSARVPPPSPFGRAH
jgi:hypothetical protein